MFDNFFLKSCRLQDKGENTAELEKPHMTIWHTSIASWVPKATNTQTE